MTFGIHVEWTDHESWLWSMKKLLMVRGFAVYSVDISFTNY